MAKKNKKQTRDAEVEPELNTKNGENDDSHNKKKLKKKRMRKKIPTVSIAVPASIIDNVPTLELATRLAGQIARAATIFRINEVVVFDNKSNPDNDSVLDNVGDESGAAFLMRILQYLETPQYLRKALFPMHNSLRFVGLLPPLDAPHHLRKHEWFPYREGVTVKERDSNSGATLVDVGLVKNVIVDQIFEPGRRVTVAMGTDRNLDSDLPRQVISSSKPREEGTYWGYQVRYAHNISAVFKDCAYKRGYDFIIGTSEHGQIIKSSDLEIPSFRHLLIAFGGLAGLEESIEEDDNLKGKKAQDAFNLYLNTCPHQGSRTIRTEYFQEPISRAFQC
ncbi:putative methyltransferase C9orf114 isoform X2 [Glycine soja]|uniref:putative methyltransferase C9orf114 isoform X2 n=1 Tax=Glycine max TaxID=3847 RepID=UPI00071943A7|nr:putative methyltransferase C9orf114 isoform X2 [Glycine max]XP_028220550.1 putative methyltransferase C9orf114 isoform X2 [Glycine soja]|eukprot:XP_014627757.1 putative methyltransferase C9orf114 isoform X2 [Glycine max]